MNKFAFGILGRILDNSPVCFMNIFGSEHLVKASQRLSCTGECDDSAHRTIETMHYTKKDISRFGVFLFDLLFYSLAPRNIASLVALNNLRTAFVYNNYVIIFVKNLHLYKNIRPYHLSGKGVGYLIYSAKITYSYRHRPE